MASIRARKDRDGIVIGWQCQVIRKGFPQQTKTFPSKAQAAAWAAVVESEMTRGVWRDRSESEHTTLSDALDRYEREISVTKKGAEREASAIAQIKESPLAGRMLASIQGKDLAGYRDQLLNAQYAPASIRRRFAVISHLYTIAAKEWGMPGLVNPVHLVRIPKNDDARDRRLMDNEESRLLEAAEAYGHPLPSVIRFAMETAMRRGEIAAMQWKHLDAKAHVLAVPDTKTDTPRRVPLSTTALAVLEGLPRRIDGLIWGVRADSITQAFDRACKRAAIEDLRFHDLRHEATSRLFEKGLNPMQVAAITGHKTLQMLKRYTHLRAEDLVKMLG